MIRAAGRGAAAIALAALVSCSEPEPCPALWPATPATEPAARACLPAYWFWTPDRLRDEQWLADAADLAAHGPYRIVFATPRYPMPTAGGIDFLDTERFAPLFARAAKVLARGGVTLGVDLRCYLGLRGAVEADERQSLVTAHRIDVGRAGRATVDRVTDEPSLFPDAAPRLDVSFVGVVGRPEARGAIDGARLLVTGGGEPGPAVALVRHTYAHADLYSDAYPRVFRAALAAYAAAGVGAAALDEFAYLPVRAERCATTWHVSDGAARAFERRTGRDLLAAIGRMATDAPGARTDRLAYARMQRERIGAIERAFADTVAATMGPDAFVGVHPTNQNRSDAELSLNALDWWAVPRRYAQTDEDTPMPVRLGLALKAGGPVWFHMFYDKRPQRIFDEIVACARFGGRVHYHAYADATFGVPLESPGLLDTLAEIHGRFAPLDDAIRTTPTLDTLVLVGWPWLVEEAAIGDRNALARTAAFLDALHDAGHRVAAVPTYEAVDGALALVDGAAHYGGRTFRHVIAWQPAFSHARTAAFLRDFRGTLDVIGDATDEAGDPIPFDDAHAPRRVTADAVVRRPGARRDDAVRYPGGLAVVVDRETLLHGGTATATIVHDGAQHTVTVSGAGVFRLAPGRAPEPVTAKRAR